MATKANRKSNWTLAFLDREGRPVAIELYENPRDRHLTSKKFLHETATELAVVNEVEDLMRERVNMGSVYVVGIWAGHLTDFPQFIEKVRPRFYVYEGGNTHVVT